MSESRENADSQFCSTRRLLENALTELDKVAQLFSSSRQAAADFSSSSSSSRAKAGSQILNPAKDTSTNRSVTLAAEQQRLFGYRPSSFYSHRNRGQSRNRQLSWSTSRHDRRPSKNAYTITAICLPDYQQRIPPFREEKFVLTAAGLGEQQVVLGVDDDASEVHNAIFKTFPALERTG